MIRNRNIAMVFVAGLVLSAAAVNLQAEPSAATNTPGVVFIDNAESLDHWRANEDVTLTLDKAYRKTGAACLGVKFLIDKTKPGTAMFSRVGIALTGVPEYLQMYLLIPRWQKFTWGEARIRMIVQDADGTAVIAFLSGNYKKDQPVFPKPFYYLWPKIRVKLDDCEPYWPGANGKLDGIETITFEMPHRVEEFMFDGPFEFRLDEITAVYPNAATTIETRVETIAQRQGKMREKLAAIKAEGTWRRYPTASLKVIDYFREWCLAEVKEDKCVRAARNLDYLESLCDRLESQLAAAEKGEIPWPESPPANCSNLKVRDGNYCDGERPVYIHGFCGWPSATDAAGIAEMGFNGASNEAQPHATMPTPDVRQVPHGLIELIKACRANNIACDVLIHFHSIPDWIRQKYGNLTSSPLRLANNRFLPWDVSDANLRRLVKEQLETVIPAIKGFDNLIGYDLNNEVWYLMLGDYRPDDFRAWLKKKYADIAALNAAWAMKFGTFDDVQYQAANATAADDLYRFNQDRVTDYYRWQVGEARKLDDTRPYYIKIHGCWRQLMAVDKMAMADMFDASGSDAFTRRDNPDEGLVMDAWTTAINTHLWRSLAPGKPIIDSEQHMLWYGHVVTEDYIPALCWWRAVLGLDANYVWVWGRRIENEEECISTQPWAFHSLAMTCLDMQREGELIRRFQNYRPDVALVDSGPQVPRAYALLSCAGVMFDILPPEALTNARAAQYKTILVPTDTSVHFKSQWPNAKPLPMGKDAACTPQELLKQLTTKVQPLVAPRPGVVNLTVLDEKDKPLTFLLNLNPEPVTMTIKPGETLQSLLDRKPITTPTFVLPSCTPRILQPR